MTCVSASPQQNYHVARTQSAGSRGVPRIETVVNASAVREERRKSGIRSLLTSVPTPTYSCHISEQACSDVNNNNTTPFTTSATGLTDRTTSAASIVVTSPLDCSIVTSCENSLSSDCSVPDLIPTDDVTNNSLEAFDVIGSQAATYTSQPNDVIFLTSTPQLGATDVANDVTNNAYSYSGVTINKSDMQQSQYDCYQHYDVSESETVDVTSVPSAGVGSGVGGGGERNCFGKRVFSAHELQQKKNSKRIIDNMLMRETLRDIFLSHAGANNNNTNNNCSIATTSGIASATSSSPASNESSRNQQQRDVVHNCHTYPQT